MIYGHLSWHVCLKVCMSSMRPLTIIPCSQIPSCERRLCVIWNVVCWCLVISTTLSGLPGVLQDNRLIYIYFESLKAKYFDRILYFTKDTSFHYQSYLVFRNKKYASLLEMTGLCLEWKLMLQNIHYVLPTYAGYLYFKAFVKSAYYLLVLSIKMKAVLHTK